MAIYYLVFILKTYGSLFSKIIKGSLHYRICGMLRKVNGKSVSFRGKKEAPKKLLIGIAITDVNEC